MKMGSPIKVFAVFFFTAFAVITTTAGQRRIEVGNVVPLSVPSIAKVAIPIQFQAQDYSGPYDPADPKGIGAAARRVGKIEDEKTAQVIKSYIPPGIDKLAEKELKHLAVNEGRRFAFSHPKEAAELVGIAMKVKTLVNDASRKLEKANDKNKH